MLRDGRIDLAQYMRATRADYDRMAAYLARRWRPPAWFTTEDIVQELYASTWSSIWAFDAERASIERYVVYNTISGAKRRLHKARGAKLSGTPDKNPSRIEIPASAMLRQGADDETLEDIVSRFAACEDTAESMTIRIEDMRERAAHIIAACKTPIEQKVIEALLETGDVDEAGEMLYGDFGFRIELEVGSEEIMAGWAAAVATQVMERLH